MKHLMIKDKEYQWHMVFNELALYLEFYEHLSFSAFRWISMGTKSIVGNIDTYMFSSIKGTISSINSILKDGRINDAYALLRKYHDSVIINIYSNLYLKKEFSLSNFIVKQIDDWVSGKDKLPEYRIMSKYIKDAYEVVELTAIINSDNRYKEIRDRCNDHTHYNFYKNALLNDNEVHIPGRHNILNQFLKDLRDLFIFHLSYIFYIKDNYMMSSDYMDSLECNCEPEEGSQYWVASFVQEIFITRITAYRPDIAELIKSNTSMQLM